MKMRRIVRSVALAYLITTIAVTLTFGESSTTTVSGLSNGATEQTKMEEYVPQVLIQGKWGDKPGEFGLGEYVGGSVYINPTEMAIDDEDNIYINDNYNNRIQKFDQSGKYLGMYPLESFKLPTKEEFSESMQTWNKHGMYYEKTSAAGLSWVDGHLYIIQKIMPDNRIKKYSEKVLVLKAGKFVEATKNEYRIYEKATGILDRFKQDEKGFLKEGYVVTRSEDANIHDFRDDKGKRHVRNLNELSIYNKQGKKVFEFNARKERKSGRNNKLTSLSTIRFSRKTNCFYEMELFSNDINDWQRVFLPDGGGIRVIKWCKK